MIGAKFETNLRKESTKQFLAVMLGFALTLFSLTALVTIAIVASSELSLLPMVVLCFIPALGTLAGVALIIYAKKIDLLLRDFKRYVKAIEDDPDNSLKVICEKTGEELPVVKNKVQRMIDRGYFAFAALDETNERIIFNRGSAYEILGAKGDDVSEELVTVVCPGCGARNAVRKGSSTPCPYCGTGNYEKTDTSVLPENESADGNDETGGTTRNYYRSVIDFYRSELAVIERKQKTNSAETVTVQCPHCGASNTMRKGGKIPCKYCGRELSGVLKGAAVRSAKAYEHCGKPIADRKSRSKVIADTARQKLKMLVGILLTLCGMMLMLCMIIWTVTGGTADSDPSRVAAIVIVYVLSGIPILCGALLIRSSIKSKALKADFRRYVSAIEGDPDNKLQSIVDVTGEDINLVRANTAKMIKKGFFANAKLDTFNDKIIFENKAKEHYDEWGFITNDKIVFENKAKEHYDEWELTTVSCPGCGALIKTPRGGSERCGYCGTILIG